MSAWEWTGLAAAASLAVVAAVLLGRRARRAVREAQLEKARRTFHTRREYLEAKFVELAGASGKPRGLEWTGCDFEDPVAYARDRQSGNLAAFVGVTISFAAVEGGGMEDVEAVGNLRAATAVFQLVEGQWRTDGRAIFNLNPAEAIRHYEEMLEEV